MKQLFLLVTLLISLNGFLFAQHPDTLKIDPDNIICDGDNFSATDSVGFHNEGFLNQAGWMLWQFDVPCKGKVLSRFGPRHGRLHAGIDLKMQKGDTILAAFDGIVTRSQYYHGYGNLIVIDHGSRIETYYGHLSGYIAHVGDTVKKGEPVGLAGATGRATTSHLHFEVRENRRPYNPELVYNFESYTVRDDIWSITSLAALKNEKMAHSEGIAENTLTKENPEKHVVRYGDSLWRIARFYGISIASLCRLNNLTENSILSLGMIIRLK